MPIAPTGVKWSFDSVAAKMKLGRESAYAIEGLLVLAAKPFGAPILLRHIAESSRVPASFLAKIFQKLARSDIVLSSRGAIRGYTLARQAKEIKLKEIFLATEGPDLFDRCVLWSDRCADANPCPLHDRWQRTKRRIVGELMERTTLADLAREQDG
jgi:Rrf2 family protein